MSKDSPVLLTCLRQLEHHYGVVTSFTKSLSFDQARFVLAPGQPSIAWMLGHLTHCVRTVPASVCNATEGPVEDDPKHTLPHFGIESLSGWKEALSAWSVSVTQATESLRTLTDPDLSKPLTTTVHPDFENLLNDRETFLRGHIFHVAYHAGQMGSLRAAQDIPWGG